MKHSMTTTDAALDDIRREIDAIDDGIVDLLERRIAASGKVRNQKSNTGTLATSPIRPAREAAIMRRILARGAKKIPPDLLLRLWRIILTSSTLAQASVTVHVVSTLSLTQRLDIAVHFGAMPVKEHATLADAMMAVSRNFGDICVVETTSPWADAFMAGQPGAARIIGVLPPLRQNPMPELLILGHAQAVETGDDECIMVGKAGSSALWRAKSGAHEIFGLRGSAQSSLTLAGRFPKPLEAAT